MRIFYILYFILSILVTSMYNIHIKFNLIYLQVSSTLHIFNGLSLTVALYIYLASFLFIYFFTLTFFVIL